MTMNDQIIAEVERQVLGQMRDSATWDEGQATILHEQAEQLRQDAEKLQTSAADTDANATLAATRAQVKRQIAALLAGRAELPTPGMVVPVGALGMGIGAQKIGPPEGVPSEQLTPEQVTSIRDLWETVYALAFDRLTNANAWLRQHRSTLDTAALAPEDKPQPDPLTASPAEESGAHKILPPAGEVSRWPCLECGGDLRWVGEHFDEVAHIATGAEGCPVSALAEPVAEAACEYCTGLLVQVDGAWIHSSSGVPECGPGSDRLTAMPSEVRYLGEERADEPEPGHVPEPRRVTVREGVRRVWESVRQGNQEPVPEAPYGSFGGEWSTLPDPVEEPRPAYPSAPATGPVPAVDPSSRIQLSSHGANDATEKFPPVNGDGGHRG
ncbi:MAG: hypothetical protein ACRDQ0_20030 [Pseudonocardia sp.]